MLQPYDTDFDNSLDIYFLNVGYGDAILLSKAHINVLIDGGYSPFTHCLLRFLKQKKIPRLHALVLTHPHPDHIGGCHGLLASGFPIDRVFSAYPLNHPDIPGGFRSVMKARGIPFHQVRRGDRMNIGYSLECDVLHPDHLRPDMNDSSLVLKLNTFGGLLMTADISARIQHELVSDFGDALASTVLKAPHHGDYLDESFLSAVHPELVVISVGINPYHMPRKESLTLLSDRHISYWRTDRQGGLKIKMTPDASLTKTPCSTWNMLCPLTL